VTRVFACLALYLGTHIFGSHFNSHKYPLALSQLAFYPCPYCSIKHCSVLQRSEWLSDLLKCLKAMFSLFTVMGSCFVWTFCALYVTYLLLVFMVMQRCTSEWMTCTLCRTQKQSSTVLKKASERKIEWPMPKPVENIPVEVCIMCCLHMLLYLHPHMVGA